jgi:hypothetical protein
MRVTCVAMLHKLFFSFELGRFGGNVHTPLLLRLLLLVASEALKLQLLHLAAVLMPKIYP